MALPVTPVLYESANVTDTGLRYLEIDPPAPLADLVRCIWRLHGTALNGAAPEPIMPDGCVEVVLNLGDHFIRHTGPHARHRQPLRLVAGQLTHAVTIEPSGGVDLWGVRFHPWSAATFLGVRGTELRDRMETLGDVSSELDAALAPFVDATSDDTRYGALVDALVTHARAAGPIEPALPALVSFIAGGRRLLSVRELARHAGLGTRRVQTLFAERVGLSPKLLMRLSRFQRALHLARERADLSWGAVAARAGYYDQPHLNHDCLEIAGCTPSALVTKEPGLTEVFLRA
jgi:AraC-like DNA-binding protein